MEDTIITASQALSLLSKARCVEDCFFDSSTKYKNLYSWPSKFISSKKILKVFTCKKIDHTKSFSVRAYPLPYDSYRNLKDINFKEISQIKIARTLIQVLLLVERSNSIIEVTASWDFAKAPLRIFPTCFNDTIELKKFAQYRDSMLVFKCRGYKYDIKLPAYSYKALLEAISDIRSQKIKIKDRSNFVGVGTDNKGRSNRYIVHRNDSKHLKKVIKHTLISVDKLVGQYKWGQTLKSTGQEFHSKKQI
ncbi:hypothetical protein AB4538_04090 [Vibrio lentus]|uniref:hypothetical protein n=1 Tax=Vibrio lentus TaxID=136468 RepID=UPI00247A2382|nr:hypothetical protein [Vibrio lentus]WGS59999.1 hypothetical protein ISX51_12020 [Vibrio lentus]